MNKTKMNHTESNQILSDDSEDMIGSDKMNSCECKSMVCEQIDYQSLQISREEDSQIIDEIVELMVETMLMESTKILIAKSLYPSELVKDRFKRLKYEHICYIVDCMKSNTSKVANIKKYLMAALFNAPVTINGYYQAEVHHDFPHYA